MSAEEHEVAAQRAAEAHLAACWEALYGAEEAGDGEMPPSPAFAPFCGCETCIAREVLMAAWPHVLAAAREELQGVQLPA